MCLCLLFASVCFKVRVGVLCVVCLFVRFKVVCACLFLKLCDGVFCFVCMRIFNVVCLCTLYRMWFAGYSYG